MHNTNGVVGITPNLTLMHIDTGRCGTFYRITGYTPYPINIAEATNLKEVQELLRSYGPFLVSAHAQQVYRVTLPKKSFSDVAEAIEYLIRKTPDGSIGEMKNNTDILCHYDCT